MHVAASHTKLIAVALLAALLAVATPLAAETCFTTITNPVPGVTVSVPQGQPLSVTWTASTSEQGVVVRTELHYRTSNDARQLSTGRTAGAGQHTARVPTGALQPGDTLLVRSYARVQTGEECYSGYLLALIVPPVDDLCAATITIIPATVQQGDPLVVDWNVVNTDALVHTNIHYRRSQDLGEQGTLPVFAAGPNSSTDFMTTIDTTPYVPGTVLAVRAHGQTAAGIDCFSATSQVTITTPDDPPCSAQITLFPSRTPPTGSILIGWNASAEEEIVRASLQWRLTTGPQWRLAVNHATPAAPLAAGQYSFDDIFAIPGLQGGEIILVRAEVRTLSGWQCFSNEVRISVVTAAAACSAGITNAPATADQGAMVPIQWSLTHGVPIPHANLHWRYATEPLSAERAGPVRSFGPGAYVLTQTIGPVAVAQAQPILVRGHVMGNDGTQCFSGEVQIDINASCTTDITGIPQTVMEGDTFGVSWTATAAQDVNIARLEVRIGGDPTWLSGPNHPFAAGTANFTDQAFAGTLSPGTTLTFRSRVVTTGGVQCFSPEYTVTIIEASGKDQYEPDDDCQSATPIGTDGQRQTHTIVPAIEVDAVAFQAQAGSTYEVETFSPPQDGADTIVQVFNPQGGLVGENDDKAPGNSGSRVQVSAAQSGTYCVLISGKLRGEYDVAVTDLTTPPDPPPPPGAGGQGAGDPVEEDSETAQVRIVSATAEGGVAAVVVEVLALAGQESEVAVLWRAGGGQTERTAAQRGTGAYRATFALTVGNADAIEVQAEARIGNQTVQSQTRVVSLGD